MGATPIEPPGEPPKKNTGLIIAAGLVAAAAAFAAVLLLTGGDDDKAVSPATTTAQVTIETPAPDVTVPTEDTLVITVPPITYPPVSDPVITDPAATDPADTTVQSTILSGGEIFDDLGVFSVVLPDGLQVDTTPVTTSDNFTLPSVVGADSLDGFYNDDVTFGTTVLVVGSDVDSTAEEVLTFLEPDAGICTSRVQTADYPTALGNGILLQLDGCSPDGSAAKVIIVVALPDAKSVVSIYTQGPGTAAALLPQTQTVLESVRML